MKRLLIAAAALLALTAACGSDSNDDAADTTTTSSTTSTTVVATTTTAAAAATTTTTTAKIPADAQSPAAGTCGNATGGVGVVTLHPDIPSPRCLIVHATDQLKVVNDTDELQAVDTGCDETSLHPHETFVFTRPIGDCWLPGVHRLETTLYGDSDPEVWLQ